MSAQTTLTENPPLILDATCSFAHIWPAHASIRMDIRREVEPDIVASATHLPFRNGVFQSIYCDPPHMIPGRKTPYVLDAILRATKISGRNTTGSYILRYGFWHDKGEWLNFVSLTDREFSRCLKNGGLLNYKVIDGHKGNRMTSLADVLTMSNFTVIRDRAEKSKGKIRGKQAKSKSYVHYLTMKPKEQS